MSKEEASEFLRGLTVLELGDGIAGGAAGSVLSSLGAEVTTVRRDGAAIHGLRPSAPGGRGESMLAALAAADKRVLPIGTEVDARSFQIVLDDRCDNRDRVERPSGYDSFMMKSDPGVWITISPFGLTGPQRDWVASDLTVAAASGMLAGVRDPVTQRPLKMAGNQAYLSAGHAAALAACHGLDASRRLERAVHVDLSAQEAALAMGPVLRVAQVLMGAGAAGGADRFGAPAGIFRCRDGFVHIMALEDHQWHALVTTLGSPVWTAEFREPEDRITRAAEVNERLEHHLADWGKAEAERRLQAAGVPATAMYAPADLAEVEQFETRGTFHSLTCNEISVRALRTPFVVSPAAVGSERPPLGLSGLQVTEVGHVLAVPLAGALLGAMGADVTKLEDTGRLDMYRRRGPYIDGMDGVEGSAYFAFVNHSKGSVLVSMDDSERLADALEGADVVIENLGPSRARRVGVDSARLVQQRPASLAVSSSGYGHTGPWSAYRVYAYNVHTCCGLAYLTHTESGEPPQIDIAWADLISGYALATVIAAWAIGGSRAGGAGVDFSMVELAVGRLNEYLAAASTSSSTAGDEAHSATDNPCPYAPQGVYYTDAEGQWIAISVISDDQWSALKKVLHDPAALRAPEFDAASSRAACQADLNRLLDKLLSTFSADYLERSFQDAGVSASVVATAERLVTDTHLADRQFFREVEHPLWGRRRLIGLPWRFVGHEPFSLGPPPQLGNRGSFV
jgi:crotonobetainyl-CoA:carnitine CoA-transferase CaiB-like acyl-CoA transferase